MRDRLSAFSLVIMGTACGLVWGGACGGGGGGGSASAQPTTAEHRTHVSTVGGVVTVPTSSVNLVVRSITFTPTSANDVIIYAHVAGTYSASSGTIDPGSLRLEVRDAGGLLLAQGLIASTGPTGSAVPYRLQTAITTGAYSAAAFPSTSYTVRLLITTTGTWSGQIDSTQFKIVTLEGVNVVSPSGNIS